MKNIYIVTAGEYSDYHIVAVFSTKEKADAFCAMFRKGEFDVVEYEVDAKVEAINKGLKQYHVNMNKDGSLFAGGWSNPSGITLFKNENLLDNFQTEDYLLDLNFGKRYFDPTVPKALHLEVICWAKDEQHAIKIANEKRAQYSANGKWDE